MGNSSGGGDNDLTTTTNTANTSASTAQDDVETASCGHMVQSNGTCGLWGCPNYGRR